MGEILAVVMNKGGVGKTTFATNVAGVLALQGKKVLIVDTDAQGNSAISFGVDPNAIEKTTYDVMVGNCSPQEAIINVHENIDLMPANLDMSFLIFDVLQAPKTFPNPFGLLEVLNDIREDYSLIILDAPPSLELIASNIFSVTDKVIIPFIPEAFGSLGVQNVMKTIEDFKTNVNPNLKISGVVAMMINSRTRIHKEIMEQARSYCDSNGITMYDTYIPASVRFANAQAYDGKPATLSDSRNEIVQSYFKLVEEMGL